MASKSHCLVIMVWPMLWHDYRDILLLRYYNGYSVREISSMLHIKKDTAQKQLWRAKAALQKHLKGDA